MWLRLSKIVKKIQRYSSNNLKSIKRIFLIAELRN